MEPTDVVRDQIIASQNRTFVIANLTCGIDTQQIRNAIDLGGITGLMDAWEVGQDISGRNTELVRVVQRAIDVLGKESIDRENMTEAEDERFDLFCDLMSTLKATTGIES